MQASNKIQRRIRKSFSIPKDCKKIKDKFTKKEKKVKRPKIHEQLKSRRKQAKICSVTPEAVCPTKTSNDSSEDESETILYENDSNEEIESKDGSISDDFEFDSFDSYPEIEQMRSGDTSSSYMNVEDITLSTSKTNKDEYLKAIGMPNDASTPLEQIDAKYKDKIPEENPGDCHSADSFKGNQSALMEEVNLTDIRVGKNTSKEDDQGAYNTQTATGVFTPEKIREENPGDSFSDDALEANQSAFIEEATLTDIHVTTYTSEEDNQVIKTKKIKNKKSNAKLKERISKPKEIPICDIEKLCSGKYAHQYILCNPR